MRKYTIINTLYNRTFKYGGTAFVIEASHFTREGETVTFYNNGPAHVLLLGPGQLVFEESAAK